ncbi:hypothetical protein [Sphingomonas sp.]|uniref:hypothetical protein n=1 Tax=Sphingomonas sp. TaxID=28214 RepID=UPI003AFFDB16
MQFVSDRDSYAHASALIAEHGVGALAEAAGRAASGRARDNVLAYARWWRIGRTILMLQESEPHGPLH